MIGYYKKNEKIIRESAFDNKKKKPRVNANRRSNNWALMYVLKLFRITGGSIHSFRICGKKTLRIMYPNYPVLDIIQRIHVPPLWIIWIKIPFLDSSKETKYPFSD